MAFVEIVKCKNFGLFNFIFYSKYIPQMIVYEWLINITPKNFIELEIIRSVDRQLIRKFKTTLRRCRSLEDGDEPIFTDWFIIVAKSTCLKDDTAENLYEKLFNETTLKKSIFVQHYCDRTRVVYKTNLTNDDQQFQKILALQMNEYELNLLTKQNIKQTFDAYERETGEITYDYVTNLALTNGFLGCHWLMVYDDENKPIPENRRGGNYKVFNPIEDFKLLLISFFFGYLCMQINVVEIATKKLSEGGACIAVYHSNFLNDENVGGVFDLDEAIRKSGVETLMKLKLDIYSVCQIRQGNNYRMRPTIYRSMVEKDVPGRGRCSVIKTDYTRDYRPDVTFGKGRVWFNPF